MLWMNEMNVQLKTWKASLGTCWRMISLARVSHAALNSPFGECQDLPAIVFGANLVASFPPIVIGQADLRGGLSAYAASRTLNPTYAPYCAEKQR